MRNNAERLFDKILPALQISDDLNWPTPKIKNSDYEDFYGPIDTSGDSILSIDDERIANDALDRLAGRRISGELEEKDNEAIEGSIRARGFETLAFYKSRRFISAMPFPGRWGIFYLKQGLIFMESSISLAYPGYSDPRKLALGFLREHERFHYRADIQTLLFEATLGRHLYVPLHKALQRMRSHFVEEALANRQAFDWAKKKNIGLEEFAYDFMMLQPNAYSRFNEPRLELAAEWAGCVVDQKPPGQILRDDLCHWVESTPPGLLRNSLCPEYVVYPQDLSRWVPPALVLPPVKSVEDGEEILKMFKRRFRHLQSKWEHTKAKLLENRLNNGLNFKPWPEDGPDSYSVRIEKNFRAHLRHLGGGQWVAYLLGSHRDMGHG